MTTKRIPGKTRRTLAAGLLLLLLLAAASPAWALADGYFEETTSRGRVLDKLDVREETIQNYTMIRETLRVEVTSGPLRGKIFLTENVLDPDLPLNIEVEAGQRVVLYLVLDAQGELLEGYVTQRARDGHLLVLTILFAGVLLLVGGLKGLRALGALALTMGAILGIFLPAVLRGANPVLLGIAVCLGVTVLAIPLIAGWNGKALGAILGTVAGVLVAGVLAYVVAALAGLTGLSMEEASLLSYLPQGPGFHFTGLLFAANILGALGAVMDVSVSISSAVFELHRVQPGLRGGELARSGLNIGRDIVGTMANTLILAYTGSGLYLMLLLSAYQLPLYEILSIDSMATEVLRSLAGSIGLVAAVPVTALLSARIAVGRRGKEGDLPCSGS